MTKGYSYIHMRLGRMAIHRHRTSVSVGMDIMHQSMFQRLPSGYKSTTYLLDAAVPRSHWRLYKSTFMSD